VFTLPSALGDRFKLSNPRGSSASGPKWRWTEDIHTRHERLFPSIFRWFAGDTQEGGWQGHRGPTAGMLYQGRKGDWAKALKDDMPEHAVRRAVNYTDNQLYRNDWELRPRTTLAKGTYGLDVASAIRYRSGNSYGFASSIGVDRNPFGGVGKSVFSPAPRDGFTGGWAIRHQPIYGAPRPGVPEHVSEDMANARAKARNRIGTPAAAIPVTTAADPRSTGLDAKAILLLAGVLGVVWLMRGRLA